MKRRNFISRIIHKKYKNPLFLKLNDCLKRQYPEIALKQAYYLFGTPCSQNTFFEIKNAIAKDELDLYSSSTALYDVSVDNIELYLIETISNQFCIIILLAPFELYSQEEILDILPVFKINFKKDLIYSN